MAPDIFCGGGGIERAKCISEGPKSLNLSKMTDFCHFFLLTRGKWEGRASDLGGGGDARLCLPLMPSLIRSSKQLYFLVHTLQQSQMHCKDQSKHFHDV